MRCKPGSRSSARDGHSVAEGGWPELLQQLKLRRVSVVLFVSDHMPMITATIDRGIDRVDEVSHQRLFHAAWAPISEARTSTAQ
jgi:hypothetical protein